MTSNSVVLFVGSVLFAALASGPARAEPPKLPVPAHDQSAVGARGFFYVGGDYVGEPRKEIMRGQISMSRWWRQRRCGGRIHLSSFTAMRRRQPTGWAPRTAARAGPISSSSRATSFIWPSSPCEGGPPCTRATARPACSGLTKRSACSPTTSALETGRRPRSIPSGR